VTNLFDRAPPIAANFTDFTGATPTNQTVYDVLGRRFTLGVTVRF
jgi:outer membrane receptor protein involved in Fe transport